MFAIPKVTQAKKYWNHANASYRIIGSKEEVIFGKLIQYQLIEQYWKENVTVFAYSDEIGIIAIQFHEAPVLFLTQKCGFGAISNKRGCILRSDPIFNKPKQGQTTPSSTPLRKPPNPSLSTK
jgi:hypothetical protein